MFRALRPNSVLSSVINSSDYELFLARLEIDLERMAPIVRAGSCPPRRTRRARQREGNAG